MVVLICKCIKPEMLARKTINDPSLMSRLG
jgi:hypothetical protein